MSLNQNSGQSIWRRFWIIGENVTRYFLERGSDVKSTCFNTRGKCKLQNQKEALSFIFCVWKVNLLICVWVMCIEKLNKCVCLFHLSRWRPFCYITIIIKQIFFVSILAMSLLNLFFPLLKRPEEATLIASSYCSWT